MPEIRLYNEDCIAAMKKVEDKSISLIVTDPSTCHGKGRRGIGTDTVKSYTAAINSLVSCDLSPADGNRSILVCINAAAIFYAGEACDHASL